MNRKRLIELRDVLRSRRYPEGYDRFNMEEYKSQCGTAGCIAGLAVAMFSPKTWSDVVSGFDVEEKAQNLLRLNEKITEKLFFPGDINLYVVTPEMAADAIDSLLETGTPVFTIPKG